MIPSDLSDAAAASAMLTVAGCALALSLVLLMVKGAAANARRTAAGTGIAMIAATWLLLMFMGEYVPGSVAADMEGPERALLACVALMAGMGGLDRSRPLGTVMFSLGIAAGIGLYAYPLLQGVLVPRSPMFVLYALLVMAGCAQLVLVGMMKPASGRFTVSGRWRPAQQAASIAIEAWGSGVAAMAVLAIVWCLEPSGGEPHLYTGVTAAIIAATTAMLLSLKRRSPVPMSMAMLALPAGVLATALLETPDPFALSVLAAIGGASVCLTRDVLVNIRIDEPTGSTAAFLVPAMIGILAPGIVEIAQLATQVEWLGALIASGLLLAVVWRSVCRLTLGLSLSRRAAEEGLDMVYISAQLRR